MDEVDRVFRHLIEVLADQYPERLHKPLQASEIYQTIIPYRRYRSALRFDSNQDYEMAVLRLLAGERDYVSVEPPKAQDELRSEAESVNPNPSTIRDYAAVKVFLNSNIVRELLNEREAFAPPADEPEPEPISIVEDAPIESFPVTAFELAQGDVEVADQADQQLSREDLEAAMIVSAEAGRDSEEEVIIPPVENVEADSSEEPTVSPGEHMNDSSPDPATQPGEDPSCRHCGEGLPEGRTVIFCPFCGKNQSVRECAICGTELEHGWVFCVICGNETAGD